MIANAGGGLLPALARRLRSIFGAVILPCYGACTPIHTYGFRNPAHDYHLSTTCVSKHTTLPRPPPGMTECMPISSPPPDYHLDRPGTSGKAAGPELAILDKQGDWGGGAAQRCDVMLDWLTRPITCAVMRVVMQHQAGSSLMAPWGTSV